MDINQLRQLQEIHRQGTISAAADELRTTQPALSRSMQRLEKELGSPLFERTKNRVELNQAGHLVLTHAQHILARADSLQRDLEALNRSLRTLAVGTCAPAPVWELTRQALHANPGVLIESDLTDEANLLPGLMQGRYQLVATTRPLQHQPGVVSKRLLTESLYLSPPSGHPLAQRTSLNFSDVDGQPFLVLEDIGLWMDICKRSLPNSQIIAQKDMTVFRQLLASSDLLGFTTNLAINEIPGRVNIPLTNASASLTFFVSFLPSASSPESQAACIYRALTEAN